MATAAALPDWKDASAYRPLLELERSGFAWEWLRRHPAYRAAALERLGEDPPVESWCRPENSNAAPWGLHCYEHPDLAAPAARPIWRAGDHPFVLKARSAPCTLNEDAFVLERLRPLATIARRPSSECLLLSNGLRSVRLDVSGPGPSLEAVKLIYELDGFASLDAPLLVLRRLKVLAQTGEFSRSLHRPDRRTARHVLLLRTHDGLAAGASQREIATELLGAEAARDRWRIRAPSVRSQAQRLVQGARKMVGGGFRALLR